ncbi:DUF433 domain-containing protein [Devosia nitrariae]|uniref:DUF433 domain-containing protein n=1 Tax=Devosia nitrariae TaxID=2071872 RepID=A0ABQ5W1N6_9HYPH|nr:DUF433 domain-containing protein [Devosia nitrariae]GLQ53575.1 hypothetical protein GCM10010862_08340 [Devosia nitrariae]
MREKPKVASVPGVMSGDPVIVGTRVLAETILVELAAGATHEDIYRNYPSLPPGSVEAAIEWQQRGTMGTGDVVEDLSLPADYRVKWAILAAIKAAMRDSWTVEGLAEICNLPPEQLDRWLRGIVRDVTVGTLIEIHDIAVRTTGLPTIAEIIRGHVRDLGEQK